jgi:hypothetical protein
LSVAYARSGGHLGDVDNIHPFHRLASFGLVASRHHHPQRSHKQRQQTPLKMKVYSLSLLALNAATPATSTLLCQVNDLSSFSFYQRGSVGEFMGFFTKVSGFIIRDANGKLIIPALLRSLYCSFASLIRRQSPSAPNQTPPHQSKKTHTKPTSSVPLLNPENHPSAP